jgi:HlyD family secretion protein
MSMDIIRPELKQQRQRRRVLLAVAATTVVVAIAGAVYSLDPALPSVPQASAWVGTVERGDFTREVRGPGSLVPRVIRWIPASSGGRVELIVAKPGVRVEPETVLVEMSNPELAQQLEEARWATEAVRADRDSLAAELDRALLDAQSVLASLQSDAESARLLADGRIDPVVTDEVGLAAVPSTHADIRNGDTYGMTILDPSR